MEINLWLENLSWIDHVAGFVWVVLSAFMIGVLSRLHKVEGPKSNDFLIGLSLLIFVWLYPLYTSFYSNIIIGEVGNVATLIFTLYFFYLIRKKYTSLSNWLLPQAVWLCVATFYVGLMIIQH